MLVSTREATRESSIIVVEFLARPAAILASDSRFFSLRLLECLCLKLVDVGHVGIEQSEALFHRQPMAGLRLATDQFDSNAFAGGNPLQFVARADAVLVGNPFGNGELELAGNLWHFLTLSRIRSLLQGRSSPPLPFVVSEFSTVLKSCAFRNVLFSDDSFPNSGDMFRGMRYYVTIRSIDPVLGTRNNDGAI